jgi:adenylate cyclase class 2
MQQLNELCAMTYEVELKFVATDRASVRRACEALAAVPVGNYSEVDTYLSHPARSFSKTDEALRVRHANSKLWITYKGPKIDATTKTRTEIELELVPAGHGIAKVLEFWRELGFVPVREVRKERELLHVPWQNRQVQVCLDHVLGLGDFIELELSSESADLDQSRQVLEILAERLGLHNSERRSYLELLLQKDAERADMAEKPEDWTE